MSLIYLRTTENDGTGVWINVLYLEYSDSWCMGLLLIVSRTHLVYGVPLFSYSTTGEPAMAQGVWVDFVLERSLLLMVLIGMKYYTLIYVTMETECYRRHLRFETKILT